MMNDERKVNLRVDVPSGRLQQRTTSGGRGWLALLVVLQLVIVIGVALLLLGDGEVGKPVAEIGGRVSELRTLALELEDKSLGQAAAKTWEQYLERFPEAADRAEILYRVGKLYMQAGEFERAAATFVRCEQAGPDDELKSRIGQKLVTCLRRLGRYGEVGRELSRRVETGGDDVKQGRVLATLAGEALTEADLDRMVERRVDQMLSLQGGHGAAMRESLLRQFSSPEMRQQVFQELLQTQLFTRRARELKLDSKEGFLQAREALEENLLASQFQAHELNRVQPTDVDIEAYYAAEPDRYREPEAMRVVVIGLRPEEQSQSLLADVKDAEDFKRLAAERGSQTAGDAAPGKETRRIVRGQNHFELGNTDSLFELETGSWNREPHANGERRFLVLADDRTPARTPPLSEIRARVENDYMSRKQQELVRKSLEELMDRYDVRVVSLPGATGNDDTDDAPDEKQGDRSNADQ
jgi:tetratricopeptide (TPR) repeat protein